MPSENVDDAALAQKQKTSVHDPLLSSRLSPIASSSLSFLHYIQVSYYHIDKLMFSALNIAA